MTDNSKNNDVEADATICMRVDVDAILADTSIRKANNNTVDRLMASLGYTRECAPDPAGGNLKTAVYDELRDRLRHNLLLGALVTDAYSDPSMSTMDGVRSRLEHNVGPCAAYWAAAHPCCNSVAPVINNEGKVVIGAGAVSRAELVPTAVTAAKAESWLSRCVGTLLGRSSSDITNRSHRPQKGKSGGPIPPGMKLVMVPNRSSVPIQFVWEILGR